MIYCTAGAGVLLWSGIWVGYVAARDSGLDSCCGIVVVPGAMDI